MIRADDAHLVHPLEALLTDLVPADLVLAPVFGDVFRPGMKRVVGGSVGKVKDEGFVFVLIFIKTVHCVIREDIRMIKLFVRAGIAHNYFVLDGPTS